MKKISINGSFETVSSKLYDRWEEEDNAEEDMQGENLNITDEVFELSIIDKGKYKETVVIDT